ncbi:MAG: SDR family oxidoreductase [Spirochaetales bacterium]
MRNIVLTGAGGGIGRVCLKAFVEKGCKVFAIDKDADSLCALIQEQHWMSFVEVGALDLSRPTEIENIVQRIQEIWNHVDVLINNAGFITRSDTLHTSEKDWQEVLAVNLTGPFLLTKALFPMLRCSQQGRIINISSRAAGRPHVNATPAYGATKAGLLYLTRHWALEWASEGILCFAIAPGPVETPMFDSIDPDKRQKVIQEMPFKRLISPDEVVSLVLYASFECPAAMSGQTFHCNGATYWT